MTCPQLLQPENYCILHIASPHNLLAIPDKSAKSAYKCAINEYEQLSGFHTIGQGRKRKPVTTIFVVKVENLNCSDPYRSYHEL
jgi:hypothetical protein